MSLSNYPPGVTGLEPQIAGPPRGWEEMQQKVIDALTVLFDDLGADPAPSIFDEILERVVSVVEEQQREVE